MHCPVRGNSLCRTGWGQEAAWALGIQRLARQCPAPTLNPSFFPFFVCSSLSKDFLFPRLIPPNKIIPFLGYMQVLAQTWAFRHPGPADSRALSHFWMSYQVFRASGEQLRCMFKAPQVLLHISTCPRLAVGGLHAFTQDILSNNLITTSLFFSYLMLSFKMRAVPSPLFPRISFGFFKVALDGRIVRKPISGQMMELRQLPWLCRRSPCSCGTVSCLPYHFFLMPPLSFPLSIIPYYTEKEQPLKLPRASPRPFSVISLPIPCLLVTTGHSTKF